MYVRERERERERKILFKEQHGNRDKRGQTCHTLQTRVIYTCRRPILAILLSVIVCVMVLRVGAYEEWPEIAAVVGVSQLVLHCSRLLPA
jgi:hypothetical protein